MTRSPWEHEVQNYISKDKGDYGFFEMEDQNKIKLFDLLF
jgi:hypothetical protein